MRYLIEKFNIKYFKMKKFLVYCLIYYFLFLFLEHQDSFLDVFYQRFIRYNPKFLQIIAFLQLYRDFRELHYSFAIVIQLIFLF